MVEMQQAGELKRAVLSAGVDGFVTIAEGGVYETAEALFRGSIHGFEKNLETQFLVLLDHF